MTKRRSFSDKFEATVAIETLHVDRTAREIAANHKVHPTHVTTWNRQTIDGLTGVFSDMVLKAEDNGSSVEELHAKIGKLVIKNGSGACAALLAHGPLALSHGQKSGDIF